MIRIVPVVFLFFVPQDDRVVLTWKKHVLTEEFTCEGAHAADFNKDGKTDVAAGPWWYEGPDFKTKHEYYPVKVYKKDNDYSNNFFTFTHDFNKDGWTDILVYAFPGQDASWFERRAGLRARPSRGRPTLGRSAQGR